MTPCASKTTTVQTRDEDRVLPANPFYALRYHFGMLLGVEDLETEQAYHRGKNRLHNAWLHREGVVWGLNVDAPTDNDDIYRDEIEVSAGLALDAAGNELHLETPACLDIGKWYEDRKEARELSDDDETTSGGIVTAEFEAHVLARFCSCLMRPVPALMEPCVGSGDDTAYSRAYESIELLLRPGAPPANEPAPYHRLRLLFGLDEPQLKNGAPTDSDKEVLDNLDSLGGIASDDRPRKLLDFFRVHAAQDVIDLKPGGNGQDVRTLRYPLDDRPPLLLAHLTHVRLERGANEQTWRLVKVKIDNTVRRAHVATRTIQELLCGRLPFGVKTLPVPAPETPVVVAPSVQPLSAEARDANAIDAGGPRVDPDSVKLKEKRVEFTTTSALAPASVTKASIEVYTYEAKNGWTRRDITSAKYEARSRKVVVDLKATPAGSVMRIVARGTGETPLLGTDFVPLAGSIDAPAGSMHQGNDFTFMLPLRS